MRSARTAPVIFTVVLLSPLAGISAPPMGIEDAVAHAFSKRPTIAVISADLETASARLKGAAVYPFNPNLDSTAAARLSDQTTLDIEIGLSQQIEIAGQIFDRQNAAQAGLDAQKWRALRAHQLVATQVKRAFVSALETAALQDVAQRDLALTQNLFDLAKRRLERGAGTQLDLNAAASELARTQARNRKAQAAQRTALARLAEVIGMDPLQEIELKGALSSPTPSAEAIESLLEKAEQARPDLLAHEAATHQAIAQHALAKAERWPDLSIRIFAGLENSAETLIGGGLSLPIPLFNRNQGGVAQAQAGRAKTIATLREAQLAVRREVVSAAENYNASLANTKTMRILVQGTLAPNLDLLRRAFEVGKTTWPQVLVLRRTFVDAQRELIQAEAEARRAWFQLELACGTTPTKAQGARP